MADVKEAAETASAVCAALVATGGLVWWVLRPRVVAFVQRVNVATAQLEHNSGSSVKDQVTAAASTSAELLVEVRQLAAEVREHGAELREQGAEIRENRADIRHLNQRLSESIAGAAIGVAAGSAAATVVAIEHADTRRERSSHAHPSDAATA